MCRPIWKMAKTFDCSIQNGAVCPFLFVKWQLLLRVTFQAYKSSPFPQQHHTLKNSTVWILSIVVCWRTHRKTWPFPRKIDPKNITEAERSPSSIAAIWVSVPLRSIKYRKFVQYWSCRHKMSPMLFSVLIESPQATQDSCKCTLTNFSADPFWWYYCKRRVNSSYPTKAECINCFIFHSK